LTLSLKRSLHGVKQGVLALHMTCGARKFSASRPATVAVHDDRDMHRQTSGIEIPWKFAWGQRGTSSQEANGFPKW
jgi:hypothetical protein